MFRNTYVEINLDNYLSNLRKFEAKKRVMAVVKANAYGLIDYKMAGFLNENGVEFFCVSSLVEALNLRRHHIKGEILILSYVNPKYFDIVLENDLSIVTVSKDYVFENNFKDIKVHIKIDTGMNRIGLKPFEVKESLDYLNNIGAKVKGIMSHFACADCDIDFSHKQYEIFKKTVLDLNYHFDYIHMCATDASIIIDDDICNYSRIGLGLLGYASYEFDLKPVVSLFTKVLKVSKVSKGEIVSYGGRYISDGEGYILTVPIGYADGFNRLNTSKEVFVENEKGIIVGSICMDQMMIKTDNYHEINSLVELFGNHIDLVERSKYLNTIPYELITSLQDRITRVYYQNGKIVDRIEPRLIDSTNF